MSEQRPGERPEVERERVPGEQEQAPGERPGTHMTEPTPPASVTERGEPREPVDERRRLGDPRPATNVLGQRSTAVWLGVAVVVLVGFLLAWLL